MSYDVQSQLILFANALWERVKPDGADIKKRWNGLEAEKVVTNASKYALFLQFLKVSLGFRNLWDHLRYVLSITCLEFRFSIKHCPFW